MTAVQYAAIAQLAYQKPAYVEAAWKRAHGEDVECPAPDETDLLHTQVSTFQQVHLDVLKDVQEAPCFSNEPSTDADCYTFVWQDQDVIAYRGTSGFLDCCMDCEIRLTELEGQGRVHEGFLKDVRSLLPHTERFLTKQKLLCIGHSKGGADSTIASSIYGQKGKTVTNVTFGSPRVGDAAFATAYNTNVRTSFRYVNGKDPVAACIPPVIYRHVRPVQHIGQPNPAPDVVDPTRIMDHDLKQYLANLQHPYVKQRVSWFEFSKGMLLQGSHWVCWALDHMSRLKPEKNFAKSHQWLQEMSDHMWPAGRVADTPK